MGVCSGGGVGMEIILKSLELENFKGIKSLSIDFSNKTYIFGDNGTGKTTVFDAYSWLLWDKDSLNRKDIDIKNWSKDGEVHNLEHSVTGFLEVDGQEIKLQKIYKEIWTKKRGSLTETFTGHTTDYYFNDVPHKKGDYNDKIDNIISEENFYLLSNPRYFNEVLDKNQRKEIIFNHVDEVMKEELIEANQDLEKLDLDNYTVDELRAMAKATAKKN